MVRCTFGHISVLPLISYIIAAIKSIPFQHFFFLKNQDAK